MRVAIERLARACLELPLLVVIGTLMLTFFGIYSAPFAWDIPGVQRDPVPVDAIPDTADNQQIVFSRWPGRSPQDVEDQVTYPLTVALLGVPGVRSLRSSSMFGASWVYVIFEEGSDIYESRSRILEKLASLPNNALPESVRPTMGPDATALGQIFWYTLEGRSADDQPAGGYDLAELREIQDWTVRYALASVPGVAEVASIGGFVREYQVDVDPARLFAHGVTLSQVFTAVRSSNLDVGARTMEINRAEYVVRGLGRLEDIEDLEAVVLRSQEGVPVTLRQVADVHLGPALRRGALERDGVEAVGGVVVARYGSNPMEVIEAVKKRIAEIAPGLPSKQLEGGTLSQVTIRPFYDRTQLIEETLDTLSTALRDQVIVTAIVVLLMLARLRSALLVAGLVPLAVLGCFGAMRLFGVDANVVALSGIAIAIGSLVDMGIVLVENILQHLKPGMDSKQRIDAIAKATGEVGSAVLTAVLTTIIGFLPVFTLTGAEGKLFTPLAQTKTFALLASIVLALTVIPSAARFLLRGREPSQARKWPNRVLAVFALMAFGWAWQPAGPGQDLRNAGFALTVLGGLLLGFMLLLRAYEPILRWCLRHKLLFLSIPGFLLLTGFSVWLGVGKTLNWLPASVRATSAYTSLERKFPGLGKEFMPRLDEGSFLLMPVTMAHASIGEAFDLMQLQNSRIRAIPEVTEVVGKIGRAESALDPAPISMVETVIQYVPEYAPNEDGEPVRQWRDEIKTPMDIWDAISAAAEVPGMTSTSMLQPMETRRIMLQTGLRAPMGVKVFAPNMEVLETALAQVEPVLKLAPGVNPATVFGDRVVGKPYLELDLDREALARYGLSVRNVQDVIEVAVGGRAVTTVLEGRARFPVQVRYLRELRDSPEDLETILVPTPNGVRIPLGQLATLRYTRGPQLIRSEDTFLVGYVLFDALPGEASVDVALAAGEYLDAARESGDLVLPPGVTLRLAGEYENQVRAAATLRVVLPLALAMIFVLLYLQFRNALAATIVFSAVFVAWAGGFLLLWLYGQPGFLDVNLFGVNLAELFSVHPMNLSVAVWVGFLALFGIATDDGVILSTYLRQSLNERAPSDKLAVREAVVHAGLRRVRPCLMTTATTTLALLPVLSSQGRGSDVMVPMAIPTFGGMLVVLVTLFLVPTLVSATEELKIHFKRTSAAPSA